MLGFRARLDPIDVAIYDSMVRADQSGLGVTSDGQYTWQIVNGVWSITSNKAVTSTGAASNPIAVVNPGYSDVDLNLGISPSGNDAIYFRVVDANNWLRLKLREYTTSSTVTNYCTYTYYQSWSTCCTMSGCGGTCVASYNYACASCPSQPACSGLGPYSCNGRYCEANGTCTQACGTTTYYYYNYYLDLEKMVGGSLSQIANISLGQNINVTQMRVVAVGSTIEVHSDGTSAAGTQVLQGTYTDSTNVSATKHGIGRGASNSYSGDASSLSNFSLTLGE